MPSFFWPLDGELAVGSNCGLKIIIDPKAKHIQTASKTGGRVCAVLEQLLGKE